MGLKICCMAFKLLKWFALECFCSDMREEICALEMCTSEVQGGSNSYGS